MSGPGMDGPISVFAPTRVDLSPGFTDVEPFCTEMPGRVVNVALDLGVEVTVHDDAAAIPANSFVSRLCNAVARHLAVVRPVVRLSNSLVPTGSGLGTSGGLSVALAYALSLRAGSSLDPADLVRLACAAEREAGLTGGTQDQLASMYGGAGLVQRHRDLGRRVSIDADLEELGQHLVLVHGGGSRNSGSIIEQVLHERPRARVLRTIKAMNLVGELLAHSLQDGNYDQLAGLMNESTALMRALHADIIGDDLDQRLRALGALAAKPCGAGGPGAAWATLVDPAARRVFVANVTTAGWSVLQAAPSAVGAMRVRPEGPTAEAGLG